MRGMWGHGKVVVVVRQFQCFAQVKFGVVTEASTGVRSRVFTPGDAEFAPLESMGLLAGAIRHAHEDHPLIVFLGCHDESGASLWFRMDIVGKVTPDDFTCGGFRPPAHQALSISKRLLRTVPPLALGADFLIWLSWALVSAPSSASY